MAHPGCVALLSNICVKHEQQDCVDIVIAMNWTRPAAHILLVMVISAASAQDFPPGALVLARIKQHARQELAHLPNYTCTETIARSRKQGASKMKPMDTVRLDIIYAEKHEWYALPGSKATAANPAEFAASGMMGNGQFATSLSNVIEGGGFTYRGEEMLLGRAAAKFTFHLSRFLGASKVTLGAVSGTVGEDGTLWADTQSLDLIRMGTHAVEIPDYLPMRSSSLVIDYARTRIGESEVLIPVQSEMHMVDSAGSESYNRIKFTGCRTFSAESVLSFER